MKFSLEIVKEAS